jgi:hypothetical protein
VEAVPAEAVDLAALVGHLVARGFEGGILVSDTETDGVLWIARGAPQEVWFFTADGTEAVLGGGAGRELLQQIAARGGTLSVLATLPDLPWTEVAEGSPAAAPSAAVPVAGTPAARWQAAAAGAAAGAPATSVVTVEPPGHPWPEILEGFARRLARHRGEKLASRFLGSLHRQLAPHGGRVEGGRIVAPVLPEATWRQIVETACSAVVAVAGRAFVDLTIAAAERELRQGDGAGGGA